GRDHDAADVREHVIQLTEHRYPRRFETDHLITLTQSSLDRFDIGFLSLATGERYLALVGQHRVRAASEQHLEPVSRHHERDQHAGPYQWRRRRDPSPNPPFEDLPEAFKACGGGSRQVHASKETGTSCPQCVHTQTCPRLTTCRPSSSRTDWSGPWTRSQCGMCLHWSHMVGGGLAFTELDYPRSSPNQASEARGPDSRRRSPPAEYRRRPPRGSPRRNPDQYARRAGSRPGRRSRRSAQSRPAAARLAAAARPVTPSKGDGRGPRMTRGRSPRPPPPGRPRRWRSRLTIRSCGAGFGTPTSLSTSSAV